VIASIVFLGLGLGLIPGYGQDSTIRFSAAHPASAATLRIVIYANGWPAMAGLGATWLPSFFFLRGWGSRSGADSAA
jgi:hypothetical protein